MEVWSAKPQLRVLLDHLGRIEDTRQSWKVAYPPREVLLLYWTLDVTFNEDQSRLRAGHGARNMAVVRHFALNLVRQAADKRSIKRRRKRASWDPQYLLQILGPIRH